MKLNLLWIFFLLLFTNLSAQEAGINNLPAEFSLAQNYPNPFNPSTKIEFSIPVDSKVNISIFNILGQQISLLTNDNFSAGLHNLLFEGNDLLSGVYIYKIKATSLDGKNNFSFSRKMVLIK